VTINDSSWRLGDPRSIPFELNATSSTQTIPVKFIDARGNSDTQQVTVTAGKTQEVTCDLH
jgi:hypothetical protein